MSRLVSAFNRAGTPTKEIEGSSRVRNFETGMHIDRSLEDEKKKTQSPVLVNDGRKLGPMPRTLDNASPTGESSEG